MLRILLPVLLAISAPAQSSPGDVAFTRADGEALSAKHIDQTVARLMEAGNVAGLGLALISDGKVVFQNAYGMAALDKSLPLRTDTIMYAASLTKPTFAWTVMALVDEGVVELDKPIHEYLDRPLPAYENWSDLAGDDRWRAWTMRSLLSHQSGLWNLRWIHPEKKLEILFEPGSRYAYSGEGLQVAQFVLEEGLGLDVDALMQERVFDHFGMTRTSMTWREEYIDNFARGHSQEGENLGYDTRDEAQAAGSMATTLDDFANFLAAVSQGAGLSPESQSDMLSPQVKITAKYQFPTQFAEDTDANQSIGLAYGLGWGLFESNFGPAFFKEGHDEGTNNYALCLREANRCILILSNSSNGESIFLYLVDELLGETGLPWEWEGYVPWDVEYQR